MDKLILKQRQPALGGTVIQRLYETSSKTEMRKYLRKLFDGVEHQRLHDDLTLSDVKTGDYFVAIGYGMPLQIFRPSQFHLSL